MRPLVALLFVGVLLTAGRWTAALPPSAVVERGRRTATVPPHRIVSLALSSDEILLELVSPERIAGLTVFVDDAPTSVAAAYAPKGAARVTGETESLLALGPDLVIASAYSRPDTLALLEGAGVPVVGTGSHTTFEGVLDAVTTLGDAAFEQARAASLVARSRARIDAVAMRVHERRARVLLWDGGYTYGQGTLQDDMVRLAGGQNVARALRGAAALTEEAAVAYDPQVIFVPVRGSEVEPNAPSLLGAAPIWGAVTAVQDRAVFGIPRAWIGSVSHHAIRALEAMGDALARSGA